MSWIWIFGLFLVFCVLTSVCLPLESIDNVTDRKDKINLDIDETSLDENSAARKEYLKTLQKKLAFAVYHGDKARVSEVENEVSPEKRIKSSSTTKRNTKAKATETTSDWSERDKRNLETHDQNDIFTHSTEKSGAAHTTESHIEVLLKKKTNQIPERKRRQIVKRQGDDENGDENNEIENEENETENGDESNDDDDDDEEEEEEEEEGGGVGNIIKSLLAPLSGGEGGGIDLDTIAALIGGLSVLKEDGSYDFTGTRDFIGALFGPDEEGKGGSDLGGFIGGLLSATLSGLAGPNGAFGTGTFVGNLLSATLPGLSGGHPPAEKEEGSNGGGSDSGGFLGGLLSSVVAGASAASSGGGSEDGGGSAGFFSKLVQFKLALLRSIFSIVTGLLSSSSSSSSSASG